MRRTVPLLCIVAVLAAGRLGAQEDTVVRRYDVTLYDTAAQQALSYNVPSYNVASYNPASYNVASVGWGRGAAHYGKWLAAGVAVAFTAMGAHEHDNSNRVFGRLLDLCRADGAACLLGPDGRYADPAAERLYQSSLDHDRRAHVRLLAGQGSLLVAAGLFIADLRHHTSGPGNTPLAPLEVTGDARTGEALVGVRLTF